MKEKKMEKIGWKMNILRLYVLFVFSPTGCWSLSREDKYLVNLDCSWNTVTNILTNHFYWKGEIEKIYTCLFYFIKFFPMPVDFNNFLHCWFQSIPFMPDHWIKKHYTLMVGTTTIYIHFFISTNNFYTVPVDSK